MKRKQCLVAAFGLIISLSGCSILPKEQEFHKPKIEQDTESPYELVYVEKGNVQLTEKFSCDCIANNSEELAFKLGGEKVNQVHVKKGDRVTKGMVLAELDTEELQKEIQENYYAIERLQNDIVHEEHLKEIYPEREEIQNQIISEYRDQIDVIQTRISDLNRKIAERTIVAGMDGIVTRIQAVDEEYRTSEGVVFVVIEDENCYFEGITKYPDKYEVGTSIEMSIAEEIYNCEIISNEPIEGDEEKKATIHIKPEEGILAETSFVGIVNSVIEERVDVKYIPNHCVMRMNGKYVVYVLDEQGFLSTKDIAIGLVGDEFTEITSGLECGEMVVAK